MVSKLKKFAFVLPVLALAFFAKGVSAEGEDTAIDMAVDEIGGIIGDLTSGIMGVIGPVLLFAGGVFVVFFGWRVVKQLVKGAK